MSKANKDMVSSKSSDGPGSASDDPAPADSIREEYEQLCRDLNMDESTLRAAWDSYVVIRHNYTLEGTQMHWLACALYVACHNSALPTVGRTDSVVVGNGVSLTRLLRSCKLDLPHFFNKVKKWADMSNMKTEFRDKITRLERNFSVSNVIFKKYREIFCSLFKDPKDDPPKVQRSRKQKKPPCSPTDVFDFCWILFVRVKADFPAISNDLVNSYHLQLSCVDHVYANVVLSNRLDLLKNEQLVHNTHSGRDSTLGTELPCILDWLCRHHDGIIAEVKSIREHYWRPHIKKYFDKKLLRGNTDTLSGLLDPVLFESNAKEMRKDYEAYVLSIGEFDERVFLDVMASNEIGTPSKLGHDIGDIGDRMDARRLDNTTLVPPTPLSGKHYLRAREQHKVTPVSTATHLVSRLTNLLANRTPEPGPKLKELFLSVAKNPTDSIVERVKEMGETFCRHYTASTETHPGCQDTFARMRLRMGATFYYKLLESILLAERTKGKPLDNLLEQDLFHRALFTCSLEIVIFSYNSQKTFPWVLDTFKIESIHFYKVIEVIIRVEDWLAREVVKHLQRIEEQILESRAWTKESSLWELITKAPLGVPSCEEVSLPTGSSHESSNMDANQSPLTHHDRAFSVIRSPVVTERFKSPVVTAVARRQLSFDNASLPTSSNLRPGQSLLASPHKPIISLSCNEETSSSPQARRTGSLALFFRKFYHLAHLRLDLLCYNLDIIEEDMKRKIWTVFEHTIRMHTSLLKDRHLDQLIMCSLYIVCKVLGKQINFTDIMKHYRNQPQASSHVYRSVLLRTKKAEADDQAEEASDEQQSGRPAETAKSSPPPTPTRPAATSTLIDGEERGDLIKFYNLIFMESVQEFALKFKRSLQNDAPPLSPLPKLRAHPQSPCRKISENHPVFIRPLKSTPADVVSYNPNSPHKPLSYSFSRSPAKDLAAINALMRTEFERKSSVNKRLLTDELTGNAVLSGSPPMKLQILSAGHTVNNKLELIMGERSQME